jgi:aspartate/methionine/tyrosine aminotransferase
VPSDLQPTRLAADRARIGDAPFDLTETNPTRVGIEMPEGVLAALADPRGGTYRPDPRGPRAAREAVAAEHRTLGAEVDPDRIVLTASTSEAYGFLFRLLADPGDTVLVPVPSYPLFEHLARLDAVETAPLVLQPDAGWRLDPGSVAAAPDRTRAAVVVHPNNPTGSHVHPDDRELLVRACADRGWALVADEVFLPYPLRPDAPPIRSVAGESRCLTFTLGGLSKSRGLPQLKAAWIAVSGPADVVAATFDRLEWIADAALSVSGPVAHGLPEILDAAKPRCEAIVTRCRHNLATLEAACAAVPEVTMFPPEGGWSCVLRVPRVMDDEQLALTLLEQDGVAIQPGYLFDLPGDGWMVVSLLPEQDTFADGVERLLARISRLARSR